MSRTIRREGHGGPEVLHVLETSDPHPGPGEIRVAVRAIGLNPMDLQIAGSSRHAARFGISGDSGFGCDLSGIVDEIGDEVTDFAMGDRVYGGVLVGAAADHVVVRVPVQAPQMLLPLPDEIDHASAAALPTPGLTAMAVLAAVDPGPGDTLLIGGAAGGVGVLVTQLARDRGARVIGTGSAGTAEFIETLGAAPTTHGPGLADRVRRLAPSGITAAIDLHGTESAEAAAALGAPLDRIATVAADRRLRGTRAVGAFDAQPTELQRLLDAVREGRITVPIAAAFPLSRLREAVAQQASGHVHGKIVVVP